MHIEPSLEDSSRVVVTVNDKFEHRALVHDGMPTFSLSRLRLLKEPTEFPYNLDIKETKLVPIVQRLAQLGGVGLRAATYDRVGNQILDFVESQEAVETAAI